MTFKKNYLLSYMSMAPLALAFERSLECGIYTRLPLDRPILDLGCGEGLFAKILFAEKIDTGIDPNPHELERARALGAYDELLQCTGDSIPKPDSSYNTIFSNSVLEHIPDLAPVFKEAYRLLAPGGRFYMTVPSPRFEDYTCMNQMLTKLRLSQLALRYRRFCSQVIWRQSQYHTLEEWQDLATGFGFEVVAGHTYDPKSICLLNDFLYPFSLLEVINKRCFNRWVLFPKMRRVLVYPLYLLVRRSLENGHNSDAGGLVFVSLTKSEASQ